jgi:hypothetical protein
VKVIKRTSLVWKRRDITDAEFRAAWLGEHASHARRLPGLREYVIDFVSEGSSDAPSGVATLRFDDREALDAAFAIPGLRDDLLRTRDRFADVVEVFFVDECVVVGRQTEAGR